MVLILNTVDSCKYLGHIISATDDDNLDIVRQMGLLYARIYVDSEVQQMWSMSNCVSYELTSHSLWLLNVEEI